MLLQNGGGAVLSRDLSRSNKSSNSNSSAPYHQHLTPPLDWRARGGGGYLGRRLAGQATEEVDPIPEVRVYVCVDDRPGGATVSEHVHPVHCLERRLAHAYGTKTVSTG